MYSHKPYLFDLRNNLIYKRLMVIQKSPKLCLEKKSLTALDYFIRGYYEAFAQLCPNDAEWFLEFMQYVCDVCVGGNGAYGPLNAIFECGYGDESGFDYYFLLLSDYIKEHAVVNDVRSSEEVLRLKDETRMIYIGWLEAQDIICKYISENRVKLFHLLENGKQIKYEDFGSTSYLKGGLVYAISDKLDGNLVKKMNRYAKDCMKTELGLCYKVIKAGEDETKVQK